MTYALVGFKNCPCRFNSYTRVFCRNPTAVISWFSKSLFGQM